MDIVVFESVTLDGVMQAPGRPDEDTRGGFTHGGWAAPYDPPARAWIGAASVPGWRLTGPAAAHGQHDEHQGRHRRHIRDHSVGVRARKSARIIDTADRPG